MRRLVVLLLLAGCQRPDVDLFLPMEEDVASLLVVSRIADDHHVWASNVGEEEIRTSVLDSYVGRYEVEVTALLYTSPLEALMLAPGDVPLAADGRRLPPPDGGYRTTVRGPDHAAWQPVDDMPADIAALRIAGLDDFACLSAGGCFDGGTCSTPCAPVDAPEPPAAVMPPMTEPCPTGMVARVLDDDVVVCELFPIGRDPVCPRGQVHFPGETGCVAIGPACPSGLYAKDGVPAGRRRHVAPGGTGDGSLGSPFGSISDALNGAVRGDVILVGKGMYTESFDVPDGVAIVGACVRDTTIVASGERLYFTGASSMENVRVEGGGLRVETAPAIVRFASIHLYRARVDAMRMTEDVTVDIENVYVEDPAGDGLALWDGPEVTARRLVITKANSHGIIAHNARLTLVDSIVEENQTNDNGVSRGIGVQGSATVVLQRSQISDGVGLGVFVDSSDVVLMDSIVRDTHPTGPTESNGRGLLVQNGATVRLERSWVHQNRNANIYTLASVTLEDSVLSGSLPNADMQDAGFGVYVTRAGALTAHRSAILDSAYHAIYAVGPVAFDDLIIRRTGVRASDQRAGRGIRTQGTLDGRRIHIHDVTGPAIEAEFGANPDLSDVRITRPGTAGCKSCTGICLGDEVPLTAERVLIIGASGSAISQYENLYASMTLRDIDVDSATETVCDRPVTSPSQGLGDGVRSFGTLDLARFSISASANAGLVVGAVDVADTVAVHDGTVSDSRVGLSLFAIPVDLADVATRVRLVGNTVAVATDQGP